jgi:hypothetical protein
MDIFKKFREEKDALDVTFRDALNNIEASVTRFVELCVERSTEDLSVIREQVAQKVGFEEANRIVQRIAIGRGKNQVNRGGSYVAHAGRETR